MHRVRTMGVTLALLAASMAFTSVGGRTDRPRAATDPVLTVGVVTTQLGITVQVRPDEEFALGSSLTGLLADPEKLAKFGIHMHQGARVTAGRATPDKIRVEADEMEPVPARATATLRVDEKGVLTAVPKG